MSQYDYLKDLSNGATISVEGSSTSYHTIETWGMVICNTVYVSEPEQETAYIDVPGRNGSIDVSTAISGRPIFKERKLEFQLSKLDARFSWDGVISDLRNKFHGKICHVTFDNDNSYYWRGRLYVSEFERERKQGIVTISIPKCDPYKYDIQQSTESWLWDPFNFLTGVVHNEGSHEISGSGTVTIASGSMPLSPEIVVANMTSSTFTVTYKGTTYSLANGTNRIPEIIVNGDEEIRLTFTGTANVQVVYRGGSL